MRTTLPRACNASLDPATDRFVGSFSPEESATVIRIHSPPVTREGVRSLTCIDIEHRWGPGGEDESFTLNTLNVVSMIELVDEPLASTWTLSMARGDLPAGASVVLGVVMEVET